MSFKAQNFRALPPRSPSCFVFVSLVDLFPASFYFRIFNCVKLECIPRNCWSNHLLRLKVIVFKVMENAQLVAYGSCQCSKTWGRDTDFFHGIFLMQKGGVIYWFFYAVHHNNANNMAPYLLIYASFPDLQQNQ